MCKGASEERSKVIMASRKSKQTWQEKEERNSPSAEWTLWTGQRRCSDGSSEVRLGPARDKKLSSLAKIG
jgi:hypothetical protein